MVTIVFNCICTVAVRRPIIGACYPAHFNRRSEIALSQLLESTDRTSVKRLPKRANYDREVIHSILDEGVICHVGFSLDGQPFVIPTGYARVGDNLYIHGSAASRMLRNLEKGIAVCATVTLLDGLVLARSAFHHSMNYRSVVIFGEATAVLGQAEKMAALKAFTEHIVPGRWESVRKPNESELKGTLVLSIPIEEASAKIRTGPPVDDESDYDLPVWAGVLPLHLATSAPVSDERLRHEVDFPCFSERYAGSTVPAF
jgi:uncharacterized protein